MTRIRVVHVSSVHKAIDTRIFEKECTSLREAGYEVTLVANAPEPPHEPFEIDILPNPTGRLQRMCISAPRAVYRALRRRPALIHLHDPELIPWIPFIRLLGIKVIFDAHEDLVASVRYKPYMNRTGRVLAGRLMWVLRAVADAFSNAVVVATTTIGDQFSNRATTLVQNYPRFESQPALLMRSGREGGPRLVYVGGLTPQRGAMEMLRLVERLHESHGATLDLAGPIVEGLADQMRRDPAWKYVRYHGVLNRAGVTQLLENANVGLVLFHPEVNHINSQPNKMFEYMSAGLPILASDFPLWRQLVADNGVGLVADPFDLDSQAERVATLLNDPEATEHMGLRGSHMVQTTFRWESEAERLVDLYGYLVGRPATMHGRA